MAPHPPAHPPAHPPTQVTSAMTGESLRHVADKVGITIPRGCKSGVCGACTTDLVDPNWDAFSAAAVQTERVRHHVCTPACVPFVSLLLRS